MTPRARAARAGGGTAATDARPPPTAARAAFRGVSMCAAEIAPVSPPALSALVPCRAHVWSDGGGGLLAVAGTVWHRGGMVVLSEAASLRPSTMTEAPMPNVRWPRGVERSG